MTYLQLLDLMPGDYKELALKSILLDGMEPKRSIMQTIQIMQLVSHSKYMLFKSQVDEVRKNEAQRIKN